MANNEPSDFSFLTAEECLFIARSRLPRLHQYFWGLLTVEQHLQAIGQYDSFKGAPEDRARVEARMIREMIANTLIIEVAGIWERFDGAGFSIPTICAALDHPEITSLLMNTSALPTPPNELYAFVDAEREGTSIPERLSKCFDAVRRIQCDKTLIKVRNYRDKYAAHPILATREERRQRAPFEHPTGDEVERLLVEAGNIIQTIHLLVFGYAHDYRQIREVCGMQAGRLYAGLRFSPVRAEKTFQPNAYGGQISLESAV
jgi:hypothetical protein